MRLEDLNATGDGRLASPSAERNREPIAKVLAQVLPQSGLVLEVGSGTGEHAFALVFERASDKRQLLALLLRLRGGQNTAVLPGYSSTSHLLTSWQLPGWICREWLPAPSCFGKV
ncbi:MAG: DUF938 domain-containing protein [Hyphomicrobiaceae bacterium]